MKFDRTFYFITKQKQEQNANIQHPTEGARIETNVHRDRESREREKVCNYFLYKQSKKVEVGVIGLMLV